MSVCRIIIVIENISKISSASTKFRDFKEKFDIKNDPLITPPHWEGIFIPKRLYWNIFPSQSSYTNPTYTWEKIISRCYEVNSINWCKKSSSQNTNSINKIRRDIKTSLREINHLTEIVNSLQRVNTNSTYPNLPKMTCYSKIVIELTDSLNLSIA